MRFSRIFSYFIVFFFVTVLTSCGGSSSSSDTTTTTPTATPAVSDLSDVPDPDTAYAQVADASLSAALSRFAVIGTPPNLSEITPTTAKTYFFSEDGVTSVVDTINDAGSATQDQQDLFWQGEFACRLAQTNGHLLQELQGIGMSTCMMKNLTTDAIDLSGGVLTVDGEENFPNNERTQVFVQGEATRHVRINLTGMPEFEAAEDADFSAPEEVNIIVHGTSSDEGASAYAIDLVQCASDGTLYWTEKTRVTADTFTTQMADTGFSNAFTLDFIAGVTEIDGEVIIDPASTRSIEIYVDGTEQGNSFKFKAGVDITSDSLTIRAIDDFAEGGVKTYIESAYQESEGDLQMRSGDGIFIWDAMSEAEIKGVEFQDTFYAGKALADISSTVTAFDFDADDFYATVAASSDITGFLTDATLTGYCTATPDVELTLDFSVAELFNVLALCEAEFSDMNFCDSSDTGSARRIIFESMGPPPE